jgi:hypothetical protein
MNSIHSKKKLAYYNVSEDTMHLYYGQGFKNRKESLKIFHFITNLNLS